MTHPLLKAFSERLEVGLRRKSITTASRWACEHRVMGGSSFPGAWTFRHHPWLLDMHDSRAISNVGQKSAQMGYTECVLNLTFYNIDMLRRDCLYILPALHPDASDFSASRFDPALELSDYLDNLFSEVKNVGHKRAGATNLYIRGSRSRSGLKSIPAGFIVFDELAEMDQENIPLAMERAAGQLEKQDWKISTPTLEDTNINVYFKKSTMEHFFFECPSCSRRIELKFPDSLVVTAKDLLDPEVENTHIICTECKAILPHKGKCDFLAGGKWVAQKPHSDTRGFYINQLYSPTVSPVSLGKKFLESLSDITAEQEFYNSNMGMPHAVAGAQVNQSDIISCVNDFKILQYEQIVSQAKCRTLGIDVGRSFHCEVNEWHIPRGSPISDLNMHATPKVIWYGKVPNAGDLDELMRRFLITFCVIDANPERRTAIDFANRHWGRVRMCFYGRSAAARQLVPSQEIDQAIVVDRTSWLDLSLGRFKRKGILLPQDINQEYMDNIRAQIRTYTKDKDGNNVGRYETPEGKADHYGHARNYAEIALTLALGVGENKNTTNPM